MKTPLICLKWSGIIILALVIFLWILYLLIYIHTENRINKTYQFSEIPIDIVRDSSAIERGLHVYQIRGCEDCHGKNLQGSVFMNDPMLMRITAPNLTKGKGGLAKDFSDMDWVRVLKHGVNENGKSLMMMPSQEFYQLTNQDIADLIAYCTSHPEVDFPIERMHNIGPIGRVLLTLNNVAVLPAERIDHAYKAVETGEKKTGIEYGKYLSVGCQGCHRDNMEGGGPLAPGFPAVPNITTTGNLGQWSQQQFMSTIKNGKTPEGKILDNQYMPWKSLSHFSDDELKSIFLYLKSLPSKNKLARN